MPHSYYRCSYVSYSNIPERLDYYAKKIQRFVKKYILVKFKCLEKKEK